MVRSAARITPQTMICFAHVTIRTAKSDRYFCPSTRI